MNYYDIVDDIDIDEFEQAIGFEPMGQNDLGEDHGRCPDPWGLHKHGDTTGKFSINRYKKVYNCFVCGGGTLLSLAKAINDCDEEQATAWLKQFVSKAYQSDTDFIDEIDRTLTTKFSIDETVLPYCNDNVLIPWEEQNHFWFEERGISESVRNKYRLGVNDNTVRTLGNDEFRSESIVLPHFWHGRLVGWQNRWMGDRPKWVPKYTNTNDFPKRTTLFGFDHVVNESRPVVIVESVPTVLYLASLNIPAIATFGATVSKEQLQLMRGFQQGIVLAQDNDEAGNQWRSRITSSLDKYVPIMEIEVVWDDDIGETRMVKNPEVTTGLYNNPLIYL